LIDKKHKNHDNLHIKDELEKRMNEWKALLENFKNLKSIIENNYPKHEPLIKYLDNENFMKVDFSVKAPAFNVSYDV
jgi:hypothetical protein